MFRRADTPTRFSIADLADVHRGSSRVVTHRGSDNADSNYQSTSSFAYDPYESGLKSTQQLKVDWSKFENHTFFNSAAAKVNVSFDRVINGYPFDGSKKEFEKFLDVLTGFEKWVLDQFPHNVGYLYFSESYVSVTDHQGSSIPDLAKNKTGDSVLDPKDKPYTVEFYLYTPTGAAGSQVILQKKHVTNNVGICAYIKSGSSQTSAEVAWSVFSGSHNLVVSASVTRGQFVHVAGVYDRDDSATLKLFLNGDLTQTSSNSYVFDNVLTNNASLFVGTGSMFILDTAITPDKTLSGALDELRVFTVARNTEQIKKHRSRNVFAQDGLVLYYKFNEPTGSLSGDETSRTNAIVLDSSGNGLHSYVTGFNFSLRSTGSIASPVANERADLNPVIFPSFADVKTLNANLLLSASRYDQDNPNLITRLVPKHYLTDGQDFHGLTSEEGPVGEGYDGNSIPGSGILGSTQLLLALLYSWAKYFDELKLFVDSFAKLHYVDYDEFDTSPDVFLPFALREFGIKMPNLFSDSAFAQYNDGEDVETNYSLNATSLYSVQNQIMRRVLTNMGEIVRSKGTLHSIETFFRSVGIDPNNSFKIKERGGPTRRDLSSAREKHMSPMLFLGFSTGSLLTSQLLSGSRVEAGQPQIAGAFVQKTSYPPHGVSNTSSDGLWTSGSWTHEGLYRWPIARTGPKPETQSIARLHVSGSVSPFKQLVLNVLAVSGSNPKVVLYARPGSGGDIASSPLLAITASVNVFDGDPWYVSFGRIRNDLSGSNSISSSYFLNVVKQNFGDVTQEVTMSALFLEFTGSNSSVWENVSTLNTSGAVVHIGADTIVNGSSFLSNTSLTPSDTRTTNFDGQTAYLRFWTKALEPAEWREHARNPTSAGVKNPHVNYNFSSHVSGSWERLRYDVTTQQQTVSANPSGNISLFDYSQNLLHHIGTGFSTTARVVVPVVHGYSYISPNIDEAVTSEKVRVRSYNNVEKVKHTPWAASTPVYEVPKNEEPQDDPRLSIEFSLVDSLNRDMITMFATLDELDLALGAPENDFSSNYANLEHLKEVYFNRLTGKLNFRAFFDFFRWFDSSVAYFIEHLIPRKTVYYGTNYVVESHLLERHKKQYFHYDMYLRESDKPRIEDRILLQQVAGVLRKF